MHRYRRSITAGLAALVAIVATNHRALGQGVTGSAIVGTVRAEDGTPIEGAAVQLRNVATGHTFTAVSTATGEYFLDNLPAGGPYTIVASASGHPPTTEPGLQLTLGQRLTVDLVMATLGEEVVVTGRRRTVLDDVSRTGSSATLKERAINELPLQGRNFTDLIANAPGVTRESAGNSIAGQNNRFNNIQIDGGANNDLFGLSSSGTPGGLANATPVSIEAIQEFVVQTSPFDVRQGNFAGGLVNAITKSGTNEFQGALFAYWQNKSLSSTKYYNANGSFVEDPAYNSYNTWQYGASIGGPIIKDKLHFFVAADLQAKTQAFGNQFQIGGTDPVGDQMRAGFDAATAQRFADILKNTYGIGSPGDALAANLTNPDYNVFIKLSTSVIENSDLELSYNFVSAHQDVLGRNPTSPFLPTATRQPDGTITTTPGNLSSGYQLSNSGYTLTNSTNTIRAKLTTNWNEGKLSNEALGGISIVHDIRDVPYQAPLILVRVCGGPGQPVCGGNLGTSSSWLAAGTERFSQANILDQNIYQIQDNLTFALEKHRLTAGTSNEFLHIKNVFFQAKYGAWSFEGLDNFENGVADSFQRRLAPSDLQAPGTAEFNVSQLGFYVQDEWSVSRNFRLTPGLRIDVPFLSTAATNPVLVNNAAFPIDTSKVPSGNILWSPRVGFNWNVDGRANTVVRGGTGVFSGRPPYVWVSNAYAINGLSQIELTCTGATGVPTFTVDPNGQPSSCPVSARVPNQGEIDYFDPNTKYPQNWRIALGADQRLPWDIIGTVDLQYTKDVNGWYTTDENLVYQGQSGEGRALYGTNPRTTSTGQFAIDTVRVDPVTLNQAVKVFNKNGAYSYSGTIALTKSFVRVFDVSVAYTYSKSEDRISFTSSQAFSNFQFAPIDGSIAERNVRESAFDRPHKVTINGVARLPLGFGIGASYVGQSGLPYTWVVQGDVNGDGINGNDLVFVPKDQSQITLRDPTQWDALNSFIQSQGCLQNARGGFVQRGACRNPWQNFLDMRFSWVSPNIIKDQHFEFQWDIFNVLNLLNSKWGHFDSATGFETHNSRFLQAVGYDPVNNRPIYNFVAPAAVTTTIYSPTQSRWRMQLGLRYIF